jgi:hypothetical protein
MRSIALLLVTGAALSLAGPALADESKAAFDRDALAQHEMSSRHRAGVIAVRGRLCGPGFTVAPTLHKTYGDRRWPYVSWRGACDSLYAPGPLVTFVRYSY